MKTISSCLVFSNGNVACFDANGEQIPELQTNLIRAWAEKAESLGYKVDGILIETQGGNLRLTRSAVPGFESYLCIESA